MTLVLGFGAAALLDTGPEYARSPRRAATSPRRCSPRRSAAATAPPGRDPAGAHRGGGLRDDPRGGRGPDADLVARRWRTTSTRASSRRARPPRRTRSGSPGSPPSSSAAIAIVLAIPAQKLNIAFLVALAFAVAASANLPSIIYNMFWRRFNTRGAHLEHLRRPDLLPSAWCSSPRSCPARADPVTGKNLSLFPDSTRARSRSKPRHRVDPAGLPARLPRHHLRPRARARRTASPSSRSAPSPGPAPRAPCTTDRPTPTPGPAPPHGGDGPGVDHRPTNLGRVGSRPAVRRRTSPSAPRHHQTDRRRPDARQKSDALANLANEERRFEPPADLAADANVTEEAYDRAAADREAFWAEAAERLDWGQKWDQVLDWSDAPFAKWFVGGTSTPRSTAWTATSTPDAATRSPCTGSASRRTTPAT